MLRNDLQGPPGIFSRGNARPLKIIKFPANEHYSKQFEPCRFRECLRLLSVGNSTDGCFGGVLYRKTTRRLINSYCDKHAEGLGSKAKSGVPNRRKVRPNGSGRNAVNARKVLHTFQELKADENGNTVTAYFQS